MRNAKPKAPLLQLVPTLPSRDTISALEHLLAEARAGRVIGLAYVAMHKTDAYSVDLAGEAQRSLTLTRGMVKLLDDEIARQIGEGVQIER